MVSHSLSIKLHGLLADGDVKLVAVLLENLQFLGSELVPVRLREHLEVVRLVVALVVNAPVLPDDAHINVRARAQIMVYTGLNSGND